MSGHLGERLSALLDGELSAGERAEAQVHLRECPACAQQLEELAVVDAMARDVPVEAPAGYFDELPGRVRTRLRARPRARRAPLAVWAAAAAAVVMVAVVAPRMRHEAPLPTPAFAPATVQSKAAPAEAARAPALAAASVPPLADELRKSTAVSVESDGNLAPAQARDKERLARAVPATSAPAPAREEAEPARERWASPSCRSGSGGQAGPPAV